MAADAPLLHDHSIALEVPAPAQVVHNMLVFVYDGVDPGLILWGFLLRICAMRTKMRLIFTEVC